MGVMSGIATASNAIKAMAKMLATGVEKKLVKMALTKGMLYPLVKKIAAWFGQKMTKQIFAKTVGKTIPVVGGVVGGGLTWVMFKPCCERLKNTLRDTKLSNPSKPDGVDEEVDPNVIDIEFTVEE